MRKLVSLLVAPLVAPLAAMIILPFLISPSWAGDSHAEYYYPTPDSSEVYASPLSPLPYVNKKTRVGFTVGLNARQLKRAYPPQYHIFAKGKWGQKLIIVASGDGHYNTLYRLRALLAGLTAEARTSPLVQTGKSTGEFEFLGFGQNGRIYEGHALRRQ